MAVSIEQVDAALLIIADGQSLRHAARELGIPVTTLYDAVYSQQPERYARAREAAAELDADQVKEIGESALRGEVAPDAARVAIDAVKWSAGKRHPRKFGDKITHSSDPENPMPDGAGTAVTKLADAIDRLASRRAE